MSKSMMWREKEREESQADLADWIVDTIPKSLQASCHAVGDAIDRIVNATRSGGESEMSRSDLQGIGGVLKMLASSGQIADSPSFHLGLDRIEALMQKQRAPVHKPAFFAWNHLDELDYMWNDPSEDAMTAVSVACRCGCNMVVLVIHPSCQFACPLFDFRVAKAGRKACCGGPVDVAARETFARLNLAHQRGAMGFAERAIDRAIERGLVPVGPLKSRAHGFLYPPNLVSSKVVS